ncbi:MAG: hypothetical protein DRN04_11585 [Thermoprotei archaeon]|nr:MAG: hypothetical protein DRN04_11585 [Thermoprotei archaeon]
MSAYLRKALAITLLVLLIVTIISILTPCSAETELVPHEDPSRAKEETDVTTLLTFYIYTLSSMTLEDYKTSTETLKPAGLLKTPKELEYIVNRFNKLLSETYENLNDTRYYIDLAKHYILLMEYRRALYSLDNATFHLSKANITLGTLITYKQRLVSAISRYVPEEYAGNFYQLHLTIGLYLTHGLRKLIDKYAEEIRNLRARIPYEKVEIKGVHGTEILLNVKPKTVFVGDYISISAQLLSENNTALPYRAILLSIIFRDRILLRKELKTDEEGVVNYKYRVPYIYDEYLITKGLLIAVHYMPIGDDVGFYRLCYNQTTVRVLYQPTYATVQGPTIVYPGLKSQYTLTINPPPTENSPRNVKIFLDNTPLENITVYSEETIVTLKIPENTSIGTHILKFYVEPLNRLAPATAGLGILVTYVPSKLNVNIPGIVYYPLSSIVIKGRLMYSNGTPIWGETVVIRVNGEKHTLIPDSYGEFSLSLKPKFTLTFNELNVEIIFESEKPWHPLLTRRSKVNIVSLIPLTIALLTLGFYMAISPREITFSTAKLAALFRRRRRIMKKKIPEKPVMTFYPELETEALAKKPTVYEFKVQTEVTKLYIDAVKLLSKKIHPPKPYETMREYCLSIKSKVPREVFEAFEKLTSLAEKSLYFKPYFSSEELILARKCYEKIARW